MCVCVLVCVCVCVRNYVCVCVCAWLLLHPVHYESHITVGAIKEVTEVTNKSCVTVLTWLCSEVSPPPSESKQLSQPISSHGARLTANWSPD